MNILSHCKLRTKMTLLLGLSTLAVVASIALGASTLHQRMIDDRIDKLRAVVDITVSSAKALEAEVTAGKLTREQALDRFRALIYGMRYDKGEYLFAQMLDGVMVAHGAQPSFQGKQMNGVLDANGQLIFPAMLAAARQGEGTTEYWYARSAGGAPAPKRTYVKAFAPWDMYVATGVYVDDLDADFRATLWHLSSIGALILAVTLIVAWFINRDITGSLGRLRTAMVRLAKGDLGTEIPGTERRDEIGGMAADVLVFREHMVKGEHLAAEQEHERQSALAEKQAALVGMAEKIEDETTIALREVAARTTALMATAEAMSASASRTDTSARGAATASAQALANAQTVASAAEQLSASIREIGVQVAQSSAVVGRAVAAGAETRTTIEALNEQVGRIGAVADMIGEIAAKTNLLALNATIEAARAGDAGKGFAVVASEVKALATQTARSTQEIAQHIAQVRSATGVSVAAVVRIEQTIGEINAISGSIAAAVEEQGAATAEIARTVSETASAANAMTNRVSEVTAEAEQTGKHSTEVREDTAGLNTAVDELRHSVIRVVRTSTAEVDRRENARYQVDLPCRLIVPGQAACPARLTDISEGGACVRGGALLATGTRAALQLDNVDFALPCTVRSSADDTLRLAFELDEATRVKFRPIVERFTQSRAA